MTLTATLSGSAPCSFSSPAVRGESQARVAVLSARVKLHPHLGRRRLGRRARQGAGHETHTALRLAAATAACYYLRVGVRWKFVLAQSAREVRTAQSSRGSPPGGQTAAGCGPAGTGVLPGAAAGSAKGGCWSNGRQSNTIGPLLTPRTCCRPSSLSVWPHGSRRGRRGPSAVISSIVTSQQCRSILYRLHQREAARWAVVGCNRPNGARVEQVVRAPQHACGCGCGGGGWERVGAL